MENSIAIVGMDCKFPGADNIDEYWNLLTSGRCSMVESSTLSSGDTKVNREFILNGIDEFDAQFFNISKREAEFMDPQQRLMLESAWKAVENAGYNVDEISDRTGVFVGCGTSTYLINNVIPSLERKGIDLNNSLAQIFHGNSTDYISSRISYCMNLTGPSLTVQTACSSSLTAFHLACRSLLTYESDMAICGGVSINVTQGEGEQYVQNEITSKSGRCLPFSEDADGTIFSSGIGTVVLKRLEDAIEDKDYIYALVRGSAINNDGSDKMSYTAPREASQISVILDALAFSDVRPETISYIEAHGTGTNIGDQIEISALRKIFGSTNMGVKIGSVKGNIGHALAASGIAGLIKTVLCLKNKQLCPTLYNGKVNPKLNLEEGRIQLSQNFESWEVNETPLRACVGSLGMGGSNAYVVLEEYSNTFEQKPLRPDNSVKFLKLSAKSEASLGQIKNNLYNYLLCHNIDDQILTDIYNFHRKEFPIRNLIYYQTQNELMEKLKTNNYKDATYSKLQDVTNYEELIEYGRSVGSKTHDLHEICNTLKRVWESGHNISLRKNNKDRVQKYPLPGYSFSHEQYWMNLESSQDNREKKEKYDFPQNDNVEKVIYKIWMDYLGITEDEIAKDFFELGGSSIVAYQILAEIEARLRVELDIEDLFEDPTVECLVRLVKENISN